MDSYSLWVNAYGTVRKRMFGVSILLEVVKRRIGWVCTWNVSVNKV